MKKALEKSTEAKPDADKAKRIYRAAVESIRRLDDILRQKKAYREVFHQDAVGLRNKLKEYCERLMFYNPSEYGRKAEEVLWRKVFYDIIQLIKRNRRHVRSGSSLEAAFRTHLAAATGYYYHLLFRLQSEFGLKLHSALDFHLIPESKTGKKFAYQTSKRKEISPTVSDWAKKACHRCLICLGDIARYQQDFDKGVSKSAAERFYHQAIALCPDNGMPHNQLGTLSGSRYFHCEAAYHYIRCMVCEKPFEGAEGNLQRLFEKNGKRFQELQQGNNPSLPPELKRAYDMKVFLVQFLHLLDIFFDTNKSIDPAVLQDCCQTTLNSFNLCMFYEPVAYAEEEPLDENLQYVDDDMVFKIIVICMATIQILHKRNSKVVTAATAFLLALFSHILNHIVIRLHGALYEKENPNKLLHSSLHAQDEDDDDDDLSDLDYDDHRKCNGPTNNLDNSNYGNKEAINSEDNRLQDKPNGQGNSVKKPKPARLRSIKRRRRRNEDTDSDLSDVSDLSEGGEDLSGGFLSEESDEEDIVGYFEHDSDSDLSDNLMESQELEPGFSSNLQTEKLHNQDISNGPSLSSLNKTSDSQNIFQHIGDGDPSVWSNPTEQDSLVHFSSELFSSSMNFLGQNFRLSPQNSRIYERDVEDFENYRDVIQGTKDVSVPPGFASTSEAKHVAEITNKLANFVIETDTEASIMPTDTDQSPLETEDTETEDQSSTSESIDRNEIEHHQLQNTLEVLQNEGLLPVVKVICDWMMCNTGVITTCAQSSQSLWHRLSVLLNLLPKEKALSEHDQCWIDELKSILSNIRNEEWSQKFFLREDTNLWKFSPLKDVHTQWEFNMKRRSQLNDMQECFLRIGCIRKFGYFLSTLDVLNFTYEEEQGLFIGPSQPVDSTENEKEAMQRVANEESRRNQLMRDMAQLRLQAEVNQLEGSLETSDHHSFPPYLIPDSAALCDSLQLVKQLTQTSRGIIVIPLSVIDVLDCLKKDSVGAREAIRWLETEFRKGNRYIRAQKSNEKLQDNAQKNLKKRNMDHWCLYEILNCSRYLAHQGGELSTGHMVAILMTKELDHNAYPPFITNFLSVCKKEGITVESIAAFTNKWKELIKNKG